MIAGSPATGYTSSDEPTQSIRSAVVASSWASASARSGSSSPNSTTSGLSGPPHGQRGIIHLRGKQQVARAETLSGAEQHVALVKIAACRTDKSLGAQLAHPDPRVVPFSVLLDHDEICAFVHGRAG